jgi:glutamyl-Q tRNA(Asp) synthetase
MSTITRFAPSPTGELHLGHAYCALFAEAAARRQGGQFLLRIEDIDVGRCREAFVRAIEEDLAWLGLDWLRPVRRQSDFFPAYRAALGRLDALGLIYPCFCTRAEIAREIAEAGAAPQGPDGPLYPGVCRRLSAAERAERCAAGTAFALRLDMAKAVATAGPLSWRDRLAGVQIAAPELFGDIVLARKDIPTSYHLSVTVDDAAQGVTLVTRGQDLFAATHVHRLLQALLQLPEPEWCHHRLVTDDAGKRLAKRDRAASLRSLRAAGTTADDIRKMLAVETELDKIL